MQSYLNKLTGQSSVPNVFIGGYHVGGWDATSTAAQNGKLKTWLDAANVKYTYL